MSNSVWVFTVTADFDGKFWANKRYEFNGWLPTPRAIRPPVSMGPFETQEEASKALAYLRDGPAVIERWERAE